MSNGLLLGIDEGTTGVKAGLFDQRLKPVKEARQAVTGAVNELREDAPGEIVACGLDHQGESVLAWDAETGKPLSPIVVWQDKRSQEILDELTDAEEEVKELSGLPF